MTNSTDGPFWRGVILDRISSHRLGMQNAQILEDKGEVDAHAYALEELEYLCDALGIYTPPEE